MVRKMKYIMKTKLKEKGQLTIPYQIRNLMNLNVGEEMLIFALKNEMIIRPKVRDPLEKAGMLGKEDEVKNVKDLILRYSKIEK